MAIKHIYRDLDEVFVDVHHGFQLLSGIPDPIQGHEWPSDRTLQEHVGFDYPVCQEKSAQAQEAFWRTMEATPHGCSIAMACSQVAIQIGAALSILTDTSGSHFAALGKVGWLHDHLPMLAPDFCGTTDKTLFAHPDARLIDDSHHVAEAFHKAGGRAIVIPQVWNNWKMAYGSPRTPKINELLLLAAQFDYPELSIFDKQSFNLYEPERG